MDEQYSGKERRVRFKDSESATLLGTLTGMTDVFAALVVIIAVFFLTSTGKVDSPSSVHNHHPTTQGVPSALKNMWPVFADMLYEGEDVPKAAPPVESKPVESQPVDTVKHVEKNEPVERNPPGVPADPPATIVDWPTETLQTREEPAVKHAPIEAPESTAKSWWSSVMVDLDENEPAPQQPFAQKQEQIKPAEPEPAPETKHPEQQPSPPATPAEPIRSSSQASKSGTETKNRALSFLRSVLAGYDDDDEGGTANAQPVRNNPTKQSRRDQNRKNSMASAASSWSGEWWKSLVAQEDDTPVADYTANVFVTGESDVIKTHKRAAKAESVPDASKIPEKGKDHGSKSDVLNWLKSHLTEPDGEDATDKRKRGAASAPASWRGDWLGSLIAQEEDVPVADYSANVFVTGESEVIKTPQRAPKSEDSSKSHGSTVKHKPDVVSWLKSQVADKILTNDEDIETPKQAKKESRRQANWEDSIPASWGGDWLGSLVAQEGDVPVADYTANVFVTGEADGVKTPKRASESNSHEKGSAHHSSKPDVLNWLKSHLTDTLADDEGHETVSKRPAQRGPNTASGKLRNEPSFTDSTSETLRSCAQGYYGLDQTFDRHCAERCPEGKCSASVCGCGPGIRNNRVCADNRYVTLPGKDFLCQTSCNLPPFQCPKNHCGCETPDMEHQASRCISPRVCKRQEYSAIPGTIATTEWCNRTCRRGSYCPCTLCECAVTCSDGLLNGDFSNGLGGWNVVREADSEGVIKALPDGHQAPLSGKKIPAKSAAVEEAFGDEEDVDSTDYIALFDHASPGSYVLYQEITPARGDVLVFSWFVANYAKNYHIQDETMAANVYRNQQFRVDIVEPFSVELVGPEVEPELTSEPEGEQEKEVEADDDSLEWESSVQWATVKGEKAPAPKYKKQQAKKPVLPRAPAAPARDAAKLNKTGSWFGVDSEMNGAPVLATVLSPEKVRSIMNAVGHPPYRHINPWQTLRYDLSDFDGKTVWLAFRAVNNQGILNVAIDEVSVVNRICNPGPSTPATREAKLAAAKQKLSAPLVVQTGSPSCGDVCSYKFSTRNLA